MTKKNKSKAASSETPIQVENRPSKKLGGEIDEIFAGKKRKKVEQEKTEKPTGDAALKPKKTNKRKTKKKGKLGNEDGFGDLDSRPRKKTEDGFTVYTEEELGISNTNAGNTPDCPFDCSCCF